MIQTRGRKHSEKLKEKRKQTVLSSIKLNNYKAATSSRPEEQRMKSLKDIKYNKSMKIKFYTI